MENTLLENDSNKKRDILLGVLCAVTAAFFLVGHIVSYNVFVYIGAAMLFALFVLFSEKLFFIELFFLPMATIIKLAPEEACLLSYFVIIGAVVYLLKRNKNLTTDMVLIFPAALVLILLSKYFAQSFGLAVSYFRMIITLVVISLYFINKMRDEEEDKNSFLVKATIFMTIGILFASVAGYIFFNNPNLSKFFSNTDHYYVEKQLMSRFCGLSADPNYFSALSLMGIAANLFLYIHRKKVIHIILAIVVGIFGLLSLSKMFFILLVTCIVLFFIALVRGGIISTKAAVPAFLIIAVVAGGLVYTFNSSGYLRAILFRLNAANSLESLTTGRSTIWMDYLRTIWHSFETLMLGAESNDLVVGLHHTHNTLIQILWKVGVIGLFMFAGWFIRLRNLLKVSAPVGFSVLLIGIFGPSMSLDMMVFDEFYWFFLFYLFAVFIYSASKEENTVIAEGILPERIKE